MKRQSILTGLFALQAATTGHGYEVWYGLPYMEKGAGSNRLSEWQLTANALQGTNTNNVDSQRPVAERNSLADWRNIVQAMPIAKNNALAPFARTEFNYGNSNFRTLEEQLVIKFKDELSTQLGLKIRYIMPFDNQPQENRTLPVVEWSDTELQDLRDWLDSEGHSDTQILSNVRNNGVRSQTFAKKSIVSGVSIEARASLWYENNGSRQDFLKWALGNNAVKNDRFKFQVPFATNGSQNGYQAMRGFVRWLSTSAMLDNTDFVRRDDVSFMVITYEDNSDHLPEKSSDNRNYVNTLTSTALSLIEQKSLFEGRDELISAAEADSTRRFTPAFVQNPRTDLVYQGSWTTQSDPQDSGGSIAYSGTKGNKVTFTFNGDRVMVGVRKGAFGGICDVKVDGVLKANNVNTKTTSAQYQSVIYDSGILSYGSHTVELISEGGGNTMFDFFYIER